MIMFMWFALSIIIGCAAIALLCLGLLILFNRVKSTRILGAGYIITALSTAAVFMYNFVLLKFGAEEVVKYGDPIMIGTVVCAFLSSLCVCIFIHRNYGKKLIYVPILLLPAANVSVSALLTLLLQILLRKGSIDGFEHAMLLSLVSDVCNFASVMVAAIIIAVVLYRNREIEKVIPKAWKAKTITIIWNAIAILAITVTYLSLIAAARSGSNTINSDNSVVVLTFIQALDSLVSLVVPIYVLVRVKKVSRERNNTQVESFSSKLQ